MNSSSTLNIPSPAELASDFGRYFGSKSGGYDLLEVLRSLPTDKLETLTEELARIRDRGARVFILGNGGSFDNAQLIALNYSNRLSALGIRAKVPGEPDRYFTGDYAQNFRAGLEHDALQAEDLVIGLSGSGNSPNVLEALAYAKAKGASTIALGGRDGGKMREMVGEDRTILAKTKSMEALEDAHYAAGIITAKALHEKRSAAEVQKDFTDLLQECVGSSPRAAKNLSLFGEVGVQMLRNIACEATTFIVGLGRGSSHFRADAQRGFTNAIPVRGLLTPEIFSVNSAMATCNDDGDSFLLVDGLVKFKKEPKDFALLMEFPGTESHMKEVKSHLSKEAVPFVSIGGRGEHIIDFEPLIAKFDPEFTASLAGHAAGTVIRERLTSLFEVRARDDLRSEIEYRGQRKPTEENTLAAERKFHLDGRLARDKVLTFAYGQVFEAKNPELFNIRREHY